MYLGVHTPTDVIVSFVLTLGVSFLTNYVITRFELLDKHYPITTIALCIISISVAVYSLIMLHYSVIDAKYAADCCKAAGAGIGFSIGWYIESSYIHFNEKSSSIWKQIIKFAIGIGVALLLKVGLKLILGSSIPADMIRYLILVLWITVGYPYLIKRAC